MVRPPVAEDRVHTLPDLLKPDPTRFHRILLVQHPGLQVLHLSLAPGQGVPAHTHPGCEVVFQVLSGTVTVALNEQAPTLCEGQLLVFPGEQTVALRNSGETDAAALITLAKRMKE